MNDRILARRIGECAKDSSKVIWTIHAKKRLQQRKVSLAQALEVLRAGTVVERAHRDIRGNWKCTLGKLVAGDRVKVAAVLIERGSNHSVVVVTVMK